MKKVGNICALSYCLTLKLHRLWGSKNKDFGKRNDMGGGGGERERENTHKEREKGGGVKGTGHSRREKKEKQREM